MYYYTGKMYTKNYKNPISFFETRLMGLNNLSVRKDPEISQV